MKNQIFAATILAGFFGFAAPGFAQRCDKDKLEDLADEIKDDAKDLSRALDKALRGDRLVALVDQLEERADDLKDNADDDERCRRLVRDYREIKMTYGRLENRMANLIFGARASRLDRDDLLKVVDEFLDVQKGFDELAQEYVAVGRRHGRIDRDDRRDDDFQRGDRRGGRG